MAKEEAQIRSLSKRDQERLKKEFIICYEKNYALVARTCKMVGVTVKTYDYWMETDEEFESTIYEIRQRICNIVEHKMFEKIEKEGNEKLIEFFLKAKGGYREEKDINLNSKMEFSLNFDLSDDE